MEKLWKEVELLQAQLENQTNPMSWGNNSKNAIIS